MLQLTDETLRVSWSLILISVDLRIFLPRLYSTYVRTKRYLYGATKSRLNWLIFTFLSPPNASIWGHEIIFFLRNAWTYVGIFKIDKSILSMYILALHSYVEKKSPSMSSRFRWYLASLLGKWKSAGRNMQFAFTPYFRHWSVLIVTVKNISTQTNAKSCSKSYCGSIYALVALIYYSITQTVNYVWKWTLSCIKCLDKVTHSPSSIHYFFCVPRSEKYEYHRILSKNE